jgi:hypothetical protein
VFLESFNEYLTQGMLKKENFAEILNGKIAKPQATGNYSELIDNKEEWMYLSTIRSIQSHIHCHMQSIRRVERRLSILIWSEER